MNNRPTRIQTYMEIAHAWSKRSTCMRRNVGAIIVQDRRVVSHGYNGVPEGNPHCIGNDCPGAEVCHLTIHAEANAIAHYDWTNRHHLFKSDLYSTDSPCTQCTRLILQAAGIRRVFFAIPYRLTDALDYLKSVDIGVYQVHPAGYVMEWFTKKLVEVET